MDGIILEDSSLDEAITSRLILTVKYKYVNIIFLDFVPSGILYLKKMSELENSARAYIREFQNGYIFNIKYHAIYSDILCLERL